MLAFRSILSSSCRRTTTKCVTTSEVLQQRRRSYTSYSQLPEEHRMVYEMCSKFASEELAPNAGEWDKKHEYPTNAIQQLSDLGLMGINVSDEYDGAGLDALSYAIAMEEISRGCASVGVIMSAHNSLFLYPVNTFATSEETQNDFVKPFTTGEKNWLFRSF